MDANGQRFWMLADGAKLRRDQVAWDAERRVLHLRSARVPPKLADDRNRAAALADRPRRTRDALGAWAWIGPAGNNVLAAGALLGSRDNHAPDGLDPANRETVFTAPPGQRVIDLCAGADSVLYLIVGVPDGETGLVIHDLRDRWDDVFLVQPGFEPDRLVAGSSGGAWLLDRGRRQIARAEGLPLRRRPANAYTARVSRPCQEDPQPPRMEMRPDLVLPQDREVVAMAGGEGRVVGFLLWPAVGPAELLLLDEGRLQQPVRLDGALSPFDLGWVGGDRWALLFEDLHEALVYRVSPENALSDPVADCYPSPVHLNDETNAAAVSHPLGDRYPLQDWSNTPFYNSLGTPVHYAAPEAPRALHRLSLPGLATRGSVQQIGSFDCAEPGAVWHRLYLEASLPPGAGLSVFVAAHDDPAQLDSAPRWEHQFGDLPGSMETDDIPRGGWLEAASELPFHPGLLDCPSESGRSGLFTVLLQRAGKRVRSVRGRFLKVWVEFRGDGRATPEVAALRFYGPRFSYLDQYLPELYRETLLGKAADEDGTATGADFLQRFLGLFESVLTPMEDRVAAAYQVTDPATAPAGALDWLSQWIGMALEPALPEPARRRMLAQATRLYRRRGTLKGLELALDTATEDAVGRGRIVILEDYRLRRVFATILGADLADEQDPLLMGMVSSGNSFVGNSLFLGEQAEAEFLALFDAGLAKTPREQAAVRNLFERLAHRVTILVHPSLSEQTVGLVQRIVSLETPAHIQTRVLAGSTALLVGLSSLVGIDTHVGERPHKRGARLGRSRLGEGDFIQGSGSLDPRLEGGVESDRWS